MDINIQIFYQPAEDQTELLGCKIEDFDAATGITTVEADAFYIDADFLPTGGIYYLDVRGAREPVEEIDLDVRSVKWCGFSVLNDEEVCWKLFDEDMY